MIPQKERTPFTNFVSGGISGMFGVGISHPIDTIKTNIQQGLSVLYKPRDLWKLYRGITPPLIGVGIEKSIVFGIYETMLQKKSNVNKYQKTAFAGACAGFGASFIVTPFERLKIMLQTQQKIDTKLLLPNNLFRGLSATFTRETPGFAIYFTVYEKLKDTYYSDKPITKSSSFIYGGLSGATSWLFIYPQDRVKTLMQASANKVKMTESIYSIYNNEGVKGFYKGFSFALMRAMPLHAGTFMMMEILKNNLIY